MTPIEAVVLRPAAPAPARAALPTPRRVALYALALIVAALLLLALYAALNVPEAWFPSSRPRTFDTSVMAVTRGTAQRNDNALILEGTRDIAVVSLATELRARDYPVLDWKISGLPPGADVGLLWRSDFAPQRRNTRALEIENGRALPITMSGEPNWLGNITGIAIAIRAPGGVVRVAEVTARPMGLADLLGDRFREWFAYEPWSGTSINEVIGGSASQRLPLPALLAAAAMLAAAVLLGVRWILDRRLHWIWPLVAVFVTAWLLLDMRWAANVARLAASTGARYADKDWRERHLAAEDGPAFDYAEKVRAALPSTPSRVFVVADEHYYRGRLAYHLFPHRVFWEPARNAMPDPATLRAGDWLLVYQRRGVQYDASRKSLRFDNGAEVSADLRLSGGGSALFAIL